MRFGRDPYYVFVFGLDGEWVEYIIISREALNDVRVKEGIGTTYPKGKKEHLKFTFTFNEAGVSCGRALFNDYRNSWNNLPNSPEVSYPPAAPGRHRPADPHGSSDGGRIQTLGDGLQRGHNGD